MDKQQDLRRLARRCRAGGALATALVGLMLLAPPFEALPAELMHVVAAHLLLELFAIVIAALIVTVAWTTFGAESGRLANGLIIGFTVTASCDIVHALTYQGMPEFLGPAGTPRAIYFWLMGRTAEALTLMAVARDWSPRWTRNRALGMGLALSVSLVWFGSVWLELFPATFVPGKGVTRFKVAYEFVLCAIYLGTAAALWRRAMREGDWRWLLLSMSSFVIGVGELAFTNYVTPSDFQNVFGHAYKVAAYVLIFRATFLANLRLPFEAMRAAEARARESERRIRSLSDNLPNCVVYQVVREPEGSMHFIHVSEAVQRICGIGAALALRDSGAMYALVHPQDRAHLAAAEAESARALTVFDVRARLVRPDGQLRWTRMLSAPRLLEDGRVCWDGVLLDVTDEVSADQARQSLEAQLRESQRMESIGTLAGGIAHDFNNILGAMLGHLAMAQEDLRRGAADGVRRNLALIQRSCERARELVQQILTFSRREHTAFVVQPLRHAVEEALALLRASLPARVRLDAEVSDEPMAVLGDMTQLEQVVMNLCTNAWQALGERGGLIEVRLEPVVLDAKEVQRLGVQAARRHACLSVRDNGSGMDEATRERIFEPFFTTKRVGEGTGLGLSVVHGIVRSHGGAIEVDSAPGQGSLFKVVLPTTEAAVPEAAPDGPREPTVETAHGARVLYIDDDEVMRLMVEQLLGRRGYRVASFGEPQAALMALRREPEAFDVLVTDFNMPGRSGLDVAEAAAQIRPGLPVVISSGLLSPELEVDARRLGVRALLKKEQTLEELPPTLQRDVGALGAAQPALEERRAAPEFLDPPGGRTGRRPGPGHDQ